MLRFALGIQLLFVVLTVEWSVAVMAAELPTADEILQIDRENRQRLSQVHLQFVHRYETTEASCKRAQKQADEKEKIFKLIAKSKAAGVSAIVRVEGEPAGGEATQNALEYLGGERARQEIKRLRNQAKPFHVDTVVEFFRNGDDYQLRQPIKSLKTDDELKAWAFPKSPLTAESLLSDYRDISIYSRSATSTPAMRWWHHSAGKHAYISQKHLGTVMNVHLAPFTEVTHPGWGEWHPYDAFFSQSADKYRVVRQEEIEGRLLTVVDVVVPIQKGSQTRLAYRGWLDLKRGALPIRMYHRQNSGDAPADQFDRWQPDEIISTQKLQEVLPGVFYPAKIVSEHFVHDPDAPEFTKAEWEEVRAGTRPIPMAVERRNIWDCSLVEIKTDFDDGFFVIPFPEDQQLFDHDAGKMLGALEEKPLVKVGQQAPPLSIAQWLDGKPRTLDELKGQVVVLDFWGLWCGPCRSSVPQLKAIQERFKDQPVTFISVHTAEKETEGLAAKIREFKHANDWHYIAAIDKGQVVENSVTANAFGCRGFPLTVIIGPNGKIAYVDPQDVSMDCDEENPKVIAEFQKKFDAIMKARFETVGESWPLSKTLNEKQQEEIHIRVERAYIIRQIELALASRSK